VEFLGSPITPRYGHVMKLYHVYVLASRSRVLYVGMTGNVEQRIFDHKNHTRPLSFTARYNVTRLVHIEEYTDVWQAISREKAIKSWRRSKKLQLIESSNPQWRDLAEGWMVRAVWV
jgi:putative endonuclease